MHSEKKHTHWKNIKEMAEVEAAGMMAELQQVQRNHMITVIPQIAFFAFMAVTCTACLIMPVSADDIFDIAKSAMQSVYKDVAGIATVAAVVCSAVCLFLMNFSKSGKTVDESRAWLKRIVVCWAVLMTLGAIVTYMEKIIPKSEFSG
ncbi:Uncharacterised protein [[Clostridium] symbiosum]|nr:hypothetical protein [[Clostridium] symbiosum]SUY61039.1 Uncharacterised protein [[Clostridium] symbiosum]